MSTMVWCFAESAASGISAAIAPRSPGRSPALASLTGLGERLDQAAEIGTSELQGRHAVRSISKPSARLPLASVAGVHAVAPHLYPFALRIPASTRHPGD